MPECSIYEKRMINRHKKELNKWVASGYKSTDDLSNILYATDTLLSKAYEYTLKRELAEAIEENDISILKDMSLDEIYERYLKHDGYDIRSLLTDFLKELAQEEENKTEITVDLFRVANRVCGYNVSKDHVRFDNFEDATKFIEGKPAYNWLDEKTQKADNEHVIKVSGVNGYILSIDNDLQNTWAYDTWDAPERFILKADKSLNNVVDLLCKLTSGTKKRKLYLSREINDSVLQDICYYVPDEGDGVVILTKEGLDTLPKYEKELLVNRFKNKQLRFGGVR